MKINFIIIIILMFLLSSCSDESIGPDNIDYDIIEISGESFQGDNSVWYSPSTGEITPTSNGEIPPHPRFRFWIEPDDPEFQNWNYYGQDVYGVKFVGNGSDLFEDPGAIDDIGFSANVLDTGSLETNDVYFFRTEEGDSIIQILECNWDLWYLKFKWRVY